MLRSCFVIALVHRDSGHCHTPLTGFYVWRNSTHWSGCPVSQRLRPFLQTTSKTIYNSGESLFTLRHHSKWKTPSVNWMCESEHVTSASVRAASLASRCAFASKCLMHSHRLIMTSLLKPFPIQRDAVWTGIAICACSYAVPRLNANIYRALAKHGNQHGNNNEQTVVYNISF